MRSPKNSGKKKSFWKRKAGIILLAFVVIVAAGGSAWYFLGGGVSYFNKTSTTQTTPGYQTTTARRGDLRVSITGSGTLVASQTMDLRFSTIGKLAELNVKIGDTVKTGEVLAKLDNLDSLQANLASAELQVLQAQKTLTDLQGNADIALATAYQDYVTAKIDYETSLEAEKRTAYARCSQSVNTRNAATLDRALNKLASLTVGTDAWIEAKSNYDTALANYNYCIAYTSDEKTTASAKLKVAEVTLKKAELTYNTLKDASGIDPTELKTAEAALTKAQTALTKAKEDLAGATLVAPMDGVVTYLAASQGSIVGTSTFITISDTSKPTLTVNVEEADVASFVSGIKAEVVFDALPDQTFSGTLTQVEPALTSANFVVTARGEVTLDADAYKDLQSLPLGLNASVELISKEAKNAVLIPIEALRDLGEGQYGVFVVDSNQKLKLHVVTIGLKDSVQVEITSGVNEGDIVSTGSIATSKS